MNGESFSERFGFRDDVSEEITVRSDAPEDFRSIVIQLAYECGLIPSTLRDIVCRVLRRPPDQDNWSGPNIEDENKDLIDSCEWFYIYDLVEEIYNELRSSKYDGVRGKSAFEHLGAEINRVFYRDGIGWKIEDGIIKIRGSEAFEKATRNAIDELESSGRDTAKNEIKEALNDLSRRPEPDITGAVQHSLAAVECVARDITGDSSTLGALIKRNPDLFPKPLDSSVKKAWGYASEFGRHLREGRTPDIYEVEFLVGFSSLLCTYLTKKAE